MSFIQNCADSQSQKKEGENMKETIKKIVAIIVVCCLLFGFIMVEAWLWKRCPYEPTTIINKVKISTCVLDCDSEFNTFVYGKSIIIKGLEDNQLVNSTIKCGVNQFNVNYNFEHYEVYNGEKEVIIRLIPKR